MLAIVVGGKGAKGARMKGVQCAISKLPKALRSLVRIGKTAYKHPCTLMPAKAKSRPSGEEMHEYKALMFKALKHAGRTPPNLRLTIAVVERLWGTTVSLLSFFPAASVFGPPSNTNL